MWRSGQIASPRPPARKTQPPSISPTFAPGEQVAAGQKLFTLEAMKMETTVYAERAGRVAELRAQPGTQVDAGDLVLRFEEG